MLAFAQEKVARQFGKNPHYLSWNPAFAGATKFKQPHNQEKPHVMGVTWGLKLCGVFRMGIRN